MTDEQKSNSSSTDKREESKVMSEKDKIEQAKGMREMLFHTVQFSERRSSELADEFTRLEVQIATVLIAFSAVFVSSFSDAANQALSGSILILMKSSYALSIFFLIGSLATGLLHLKRKEKFWDDLIKSGANLKKNWNDVMRGTKTYEQASSYHSGVAELNPSVLFSPLWTWVIQTICLGLAILLLFSIFMIFLFI